MKNNMEYYFKKNKWVFKNDFKSVNKIYKFMSFMTAISWMTEIAQNIELNDHHPEWKNIYDKVEVELSTHDQKKVTEKDLILAKVMDAAFEKYI